MADPDFESAILKHVNSPNYQAVKPKVIAKQLELPPERHQEMRRTIKKLAQRGLLQYGQRGVVRPARKDKKPKDHLLVTGIFRRTSSGYGFVRPSPAARISGIDQDVYVPASRAYDASSGDTVTVRVQRDRKDANRLRGEILEIVDRDTNYVVGTYHQQFGTGLVQVDGNLFSHPVEVGDPGAKDVQEGDKVVVEMVRFPTHYHPGEGVVVEVLGPKGAPGVDTLSIIREFNLPQAFPEEAMAVAREQASRFDESLQGRTDLTDLPVITIDPYDARDFDDAISLERLKNGHWRLGVHIADVAHFVPAGSALDDEARDRATSVYLPDRVLPMLPELISNNLASLQPDRIRYTKSVFVEFTSNGAVVGSDTTNSAIRSRRRFTYEDVDQYLAAPESWRDRLAPEVYQLLGEMHQLAMILRGRRLQAGSIELTLPDTKIDLDHEGRVSGAHLEENTESHQIIEEFMLAANQAVALSLFERDLNCLRRIHPPPVQEKLERLTQFVRVLGIECEHLQSRFEIKRVVEQVAGKPEERAVHFAVLRSMQKAIYSPEEEKHYALNFDHYCHFTSPIRRYPDLVIHRMLDDLHRSKRPADDFDRLLVLGDHCSEREKRAEAAERELIKVKLLTYLSTRIGDRMKAVVTGVEDFGLFAQGLTLPAEGLIHVSTLQDDYYHFDPQTHTLMGRREENLFRLGDVVEVEINHVDIDRRQLDFRLIKRLKHKGKLPGAAPPATKAGRKKKKAKRLGRKRATVQQDGTGKRKRKTGRTKKGKRG